MRLLHASGEPDRDPRPRLLLISYHFPPDTTVGARRWEKMARFVAERGWALDVITRDPAALDPPRMDALPQGVRVYGVPHTPLTLDRLEEGAWQRFRKSRPARAASPSAGGDGGAASGTARAHTLDIDDIRQEGFTPRGALRAWWAWRSVAGMRAWARDAAAAALAIRTARHFAIVSSGPPHVSHAAGCVVSRRTGLPLVVDMRDPWSLSPRLPEALASPLWFWMARRQERATVRQARLIAANTDVARDALARLYPERRGEILAVMNGVDDDPLPPPAYGSRFTIRYAGTIYLPRDPQILLAGAALAIGELGLRPEQIGIDFLGEFDGPGEIPITALAAAAGIAPFVTVTPRQPHAQAMQFLAGAQMLVTFGGWSTMTIPAKTFECVRFPAWLLALSDLNSANGALLRGTGADVVESHDPANIAVVIRRRYLEFLHGERPEAIASDGRFSRRAQAAILLDAIARLAPPPQPEPETERRAERATRS